MLKKVTLYTDGACSCNPGPGGYCGILIYKDTELVVNGGKENTTNNEMELTAVIEGLLKLKEKCFVTVYSDSAYVVNAVNCGWLASWSENDWKTADKKEVKNRELWEKLLNLLFKHEVSFQKVKGHADDVLNNRCDKIARESIPKV